MPSARPPLTPTQILAEADRRARFEVVADRVWGHAPRPGHWKTPPLPPLGRLPHTAPDASMARMRAVCALLALESAPGPNVADMRRLIRTLGAACAPNASSANTARREPSLAKILASAWSVPSHPALESLLLMGVAIESATDPRRETGDLHATLGMCLSVTEAAFTAGRADSPAMEACAAFLARSMDGSPAKPSFYDTARAYGAHHGLRAYHVLCLIGLGALVPTSRRWLAKREEPGQGP